VSLHLLAQSVYEYIRKQCEIVFSETSNQNEMRFVTFSFSPQTTLSICQQLDVYRKELEAQKHGKVRFLMKVARSLNQEWQSLLSNGISQGKVDSGLGAVLKALHDNDWIDSTDQLTSIRNTLAESNERLVIVLFGLDKTLDRGSLEDFHVISEESIWTNEMQRSYSNWIRIWCQRYEIEPLESDLDSIDLFFNELFKLLPKNLSALSDFLDDLYDESAEIYSSKDLLKHLFIQLPKWGLPPIDIKGKNIKQSLSILNAAFDFIDYKMFMEQSIQKTKIQALCRFIKQVELGEKSFYLPEIPPKFLTQAQDIITQRLYIVPEVRDESYQIIELPEDELSFLNMLKSYIESKDLLSQKLMLYYDFLPTYELLKLKPPKKERKPQVRLRREHHAEEAFLFALWECLKEVKSQYPHEDLYQALSSITISLTRFSHDLDFDEAFEELNEETGSNHIAAQYLKRCLGGLDELFQNSLFDELLSAKNRLSSDNKEDEEQVFSFKIYDEINYKKAASTSIPSLEFYIEVYHSAGIDNVPFKNMYKWYFPQTQSVRVANALFNRVLESINEGFNNRRPFAYQITNHDALFFSGDTYEVNRLLSLSEVDFKQVELVKTEVYQTWDTEIKTKLRELNDAYLGFIQSQHTDGFYKALISQDKLIKSYKQLDVYIQNKNATDSILSVLSKLYLILPQHQDFNLEHTPNAIVTALHPAVLELYMARCNFLMKASAAMFKSLLENKIGKLYEKEFEKILDIAQMKRPLWGILKNQDLSFTSSGFSFDFNQCLGEPLNQLSLPQQSFLREEEWTDDLKKNELTKNSPESKIIIELIRDYINYNKKADDGLELCFVNLSQAQPLIAALDFHLNEIHAKFKNRVNPYYLSLTLLVSQPNVRNVKYWLESWQQYWDPKYGESAYENCEIQIAIKPYADSPADNYVQCQKLIQDGDDYDMAFVYQFLTNDVEGDKLQPFQIEPERDYNDYYVFPIVRYPAILEGEHNQDRRYSVLSNHRLQVASQHVSTLSRIKNSEGHSHHHLVYSAVNMRPWRDVIGYLHHKAQWVVCIDQHIDERLLQVTKSIDPLEIISFSSGKGAYGELNVTISTCCSNFSELQKRLQQSLRDKNILSNEFSVADREAITNEIKQHFHRLTGMSLIKAIHRKNKKELWDVFSYSLTHKLLPESKKAITECMISLDALPHWFELDYIVQDTKTDKPRRPDLLHLRVFDDLDKNILNIEATLIECKLGLKEHIKINQAQQQIQSGFDCLMKKFLPYFERPNQDQAPNYLYYLRRYWWAQLHRLIVTKSNFSHTSDIKRYTSLFEKMISGQFNISWKGLICTYWTNTETPEYEINYDLQWTNLKSVEDIELLIPEEQYNTGRLPVYHVTLSSQNFIPLIQGKYALDFTAHTPHNSFQSIQISAHPSLCHENDKAPYQEDREPSDKIEPSTFASADSHSGNEENKVHLSDTTSQLQKQPSSKVDVVETPNQKSFQATPIYALSNKAVPQRILLGNQKNTDQPIFWEYGHPNLTNRHMIIFGSSGQGKSYAIQTILAEMAAQHQNSVIIDYTDGFLPNRLEDGFKNAVNPKSYINKQAPFPLNIFKSQNIQIDEQFIPEGPHDIADRVTGIFDTVYQLGDQQRSKLYQIIQEEIESQGDQFNLQRLAESLKSREKDKTAASIQSKILPFVQSKPFSLEKTGEHWGQFYHNTKQQVHILQLTRMSRIASRLTTEFLLWDLFSYSQNNGSPKNPLTIVLDEVQNLSHKLEDPIGKMLTEGRKFGVSLITATQTLSNLKKDEIDRLFQASHKLFFKPADTELKNFARIIAELRQEDASDWSHNLSRLKKGECYSLGPEFQKDREVVRPRHIEIAALEKRFKE